MRLLLIACVTALAGCVVEAEPPQGNLELQWLFQGQDCVGAGVGTVSVRVFDSAGNTVADDTFPCDQHVADYDGLPIGDYDFDLAGFSPGGTLLYQGAGGIEVHEDATSTAQVDLSVPP